MLSVSGFGWDDEKKVVQVERSVYVEWVKLMYGKDRATGAASESFAQAVHNIEEDLARDSVTIDSDYDIGDETEAESESLNSASGSRKRKDPPSVRSEKRSRRSKKSEDIVDLTSSFHSASNKIGKVFEDMNSNLVAIAQVWSSEEEREKN